MKFIVLVFATLSLTALANDSDGPGGPASHDEGMKQMHPMGPPPMGRPGDDEDGGRRPMGPPPGMMGGFPGGKELDNPAKFDEHKKEILKMLDEAIQSQQELRSCISNAKDKAAFMKCQESMQEKRKAQWEKMREKREQLRHEEHPKE